MMDAPDRERQRTRPVDEIHARTTDVDLRTDILARTTDLHGRGSDIRLQETASDLSTGAVVSGGEGTRGDAASRTTLTFCSGSSRLADPPVSAGSTFAGKYRLERVLGRGAVGVVYLAHDLSLEREVAVKILLPAHAADVRTASSFHHEAVSMASVCHVNVVRIYTSGQWDGLLFFVMEYVPGRSVAALIKERFGGGGFIAVETLLGIVDDVCVGLGALHAHGIFHGDVKPGNMLIDHGNHVAITDFGLGGSSVAAIDDIERVEANTHHISGGTPLYVAPELLVGKVVPLEDRHLCDVYSLGASVFEMFTGRGPFVGRTIKDILKAHIFAPAPELTTLRPDLPVALDPVIRKALAKQPRQRYSKCEDFAFAVNRAAQEHAA